MPLKTVESPMTLFSAKTRVDISSYNSWFVFSVPIEIFIVRLSLIADFHDI